MDTLNIAMRAGILALALGGCSTQEPMTDFAGNVYPAECRGDLSGVKAPIIFTAPDIMAKLGEARHLAYDQRLYGLTLNRQIIFIDSSLEGWKREDAIRHERCHILTGDWHK